MASGIILGWLAHLLASRRDHRNRVNKAKADFGVFINRQLGILPQVEIRHFYTLTKPFFNSEIHGLKYFLTDSQRARIDRLWKEYDEITEEDLSEDRENEHGTTWEEGLNDAVYTIPTTNPSHPRDVLKNYFVEFNKFSEV